MGDTSIEISKDTVVIGKGSQEPNNTNGRAIGDVIAMQMASITYCSLNGNKSVQKTLNHYLPNWTLVWEPVQAIQGNWAFIAYNGVQYVLAIRGSILNFSWGAFDNWFKQDFNIFEQEAFPYHSDPSKNPMISKGSSEGLNNLMQLQDSNGDTILQYFQKYVFPNNKWICVTGHSLGANLATVVAPWLRYELLQGGYTIPAIFSVLTFAAPTSWNADFAQEFDANFQQSWRYYNELDIVPFSATNIFGLGSLYPSPAPAASSIYATYDGHTVTLPEAFDTIAIALAGTEIYYDSVYTQVNQTRGSVALNTGKEVFPIDATKPLLEQWFAEAGQQHAHNHYLKWLGANSLNCVT